MCFDKNKLMDIISNGNEIIVNMSSWHCIPYVPTKLLNAMFLPTKRSVSCFAHVSGTFHKPIPHVMSTSTCAHFLFYIAHIPRPHVWFIILLYTYPKRRQSNHSCCMLLFRFLCLHNILCLHTGLAHIRVSCSLFEGFMCKRDIFIQQT